MKRRQFLAGSASVLTGAAAGFGSASQPSARPSSVDKFKLHYAPHPGMFKNSAGENVLDQIKFAADQGFTAWEDNGMRQRSPEEQGQIARTLSDRGMQMGVFVAHGSIGKLTFAKKDQAVWESVLADLRHSVEVARRVNAKWMTVVPGDVDEDRRSRLAPGYQEANVIELLRRGVEVFEPHGLTMVLEPLNWYTDHGGVFLRYSDQAYALCKAVNSPACKILFDIYHQQITEGNLIPNMDRSWDEIAYIQSGDNPGRKEPGTGEINYLNVFRHLKKKGFQGIIGMEHGNSQAGKEGERAVIEAYREVDV
jgi:hydroxypyruvate isomerase